MFNALKYTKKLEEVGLTRDQAETHMLIMTELIETSFATKQDMKDVRVDLESVRVSLDNKISQVERQFENKMIQLEYRLTIKLGTIVSVAIGVAVALTKVI